MNSFEYIEVSVRLEPFSEETAEMLMAELAELPYDSFVTEEPVLKAYIPLSEYRPGDLKVVLSGYPDVAGFEAVPIQGQNWNKEWERSPARGSTSGSTRKWPSAPARTTRPT